MGILNYTTKISVNQTLNEISAKLAKAGANAIMTEYTDGKPSHISFRIDTKHGVISYRLPANFEKVLVIMQTQQKKNLTPQLIEQSHRVTWRILKDWLEAQLALIEVEMAELPQIFLPYAQTANGTVYECFERGGLQALTYEGKSQ